TATGGTIRDLAMGPLMTTFYYITAPAGGLPAGVYQFNPFSGESTALPGSFASPTRLATNRQGQVYVLDGSTIYLIDPNAPVGIPPPSINSQDVNNITYDDSNDVLVGVNSSQRMVYQWANGLAGGSAVHALPVDPCVFGRLSITISPADGSLWITGSNCS